MAAERFAQDISNLLSLDFLNEYAAEKAAEEFAAKYDIPGRFGYNAVQGSLFEKRFGISYIQQGWLNKHGRMVPMLVPFLFVREKGVDNKSCERALREFFNGAVDIEEDVIRDASSFELLPHKAQDGKSLVFRIRYAANLLCSTYYSNSGNENILNQLLEQQFRLL